MAEFDYKYKYELGGGIGTIDAKDAKDAEQKVKDSIPTLYDEDGKPKPVNDLKITVSKSKPQK